MSWGVYLILFIFAAFIVLLIINPNVSCFGKRVKSPFTPLMRKREIRKKMTDYKFDLGGGAGGKGKTSPERKPGGKTDKEPNKKSDKKTDDYGFRLD
jgi:hypothetical protein